LSVHKSAIIEKAQKLASKGQFEQAIQQWRKLALASPTDGNVYNSIGDLHLKTGQEAEATNCFIKAAEAFQSTGFELKSIAVFKKALKLDPYRINISEKLADIYVDRGLLGNAMSGYLQVAKAYFSRGDFEDALSAYRKLSDLDPSNTNILLEIAGICRTEGDNDDAITVYKKLLAIFKEKNQTSEIEKIVSQITELDPSYGTQNKASPEKTELSEEPQLELSPEFNTDIGDNPTHSNFSEPEVASSAPPVYSPSELFEPEPELMTEEQTDYSTEESTHPPLHLEDVADEEQLFQEISHEFEENTGEGEIGTFDLPDLDSPPSDYRGNDDLPGLEQDPLSSMTEHSDKPFTTSDALFLDSDPFDLKDLEASSLSDNTYEIDFDDSTQNKLLSSDMINNELKQASDQAPEESHPLPLITKNTSPLILEGRTEAKEEYVDLQAYISDELELEEEEVEETRLESTMRTMPDRPRGDHPLAEALESEYDLGIAYREMGLLSEATRAFEKASQGNARFQDAITMLASCHRERGYIEEAFASLEKGLKQSTADQEATLVLKYELALLHDEQGNQRKAAPLYDAVFEIDPNYREVSKKRTQASRAIFSMSPQSLSKPGVITKKKPIKKRDRVSYL